MPKITFKLEAIVHVLCKIENITRGENPSISQRSECELVNASLVLLFAPIAMASVARLIRVILGSMEFGRHRLVQEKDVSRAQFELKSNLTFLMLYFAVQ